MSKIALIVPLAAVLAACTTPYGQGDYAEPYPQPPAPYPTPYPQNPAPLPPPTPTPTGESFRAIGTEPFWDLTITENMTFTDRGTNLQVIQATPKPRHAKVSDVFFTPRMQVTIHYRQCSDGMSDRVYPHEVTVDVDGQRYRGCGAPASFFTQVGENGLPGQGVGTLSGTEWRVTTVNGRATPVGDYFLRFDGDRLSAKFGCNGMGAGYSTSGSTLNVGALLSTRMACPDMSWETSGAAILAQPMRVDLSNPESMVLTNAAGTIVTRKFHR